MPRQPNYKFERLERDRQKAIKAAQKAEAKRALKESGADPNAETPETGDADPDSDPE